MRGIYLPVPRARHALFVLVESAILIGSLLIAILWRSGSLANAPNWEPLLVPKALVTTLVIQMCMYYAELYDDRSMRFKTELVLRIAQSLGIATLLLALVYYTLPQLKVGRTIYLLFLAIAVAGVLLWRSIYLWATGKDALTDNVLILGTGVSAQQIAMEMLAREPLGYRIAGFLGEHPAEVGRKLVNMSVIGTIAELQQLVPAKGVSLIVVALEDRRGKMPVKELTCKMAGVAVEEATGFYERLTGKILVNNLRPSWLVFSQGFSKPRLLRNSKRAAEFLMALVLLLLTAPLMLVLALLIRLDSRGRSFYMQERVGERGTLFKLIKFRTMRTDAEAATGPVWAPADGDTRVTRLGRMMRKTRLDELPQVLNVLRGEMSFVGPRPERPHFVEQFRKIIPYYDERHSVNPGITGWAQVKFRYGSTIEDAEEKHQFDLYYIKHMSLWFDFIILLDTFKVVLFGKGAR